MSQLFVIHWRSNATNKTGNGVPIGFIDRKDAKKHCWNLNKQFRFDVYHWPVRYDGPPLPPLSVDGDQEITQQEVEQIIGEVRALVDELADAGRETTT